MMLANRPTASLSSDCNPAVGLSANPTTSLKSHVCVCLAVVSPVYLLSDHPSASCIVQLRSCIVQLRLSPYLFKLARELPSLSQAHNCTLISIQAHTRTSYLRASCTIISYCLVVSSTHHMICRRRGCKGNLLWQTPADNGSK